MKEVELADFLWNIFPTYLVWTFWGVIRMIQAGEASNSQAGMIFAYVSCTPSVIILAVLMFSLLWDSWGEFKEFVANVLAHGGYLGWTN